MSYPSDTPLNDLGREIHHWANGKGWWELLPEDVREEVGGVDRLGPKLQDYLRYLLLNAKMLLVVSEVCEALEHLRNGLPTNEVHFDGDKPDGFAIEWADVDIRVHDLAAWLGLDMDSLVAQKMAYNRTRAYRHGGKKS